MVVWLSPYSSTWFDHCTLSSFPGLPQHIVSNKGVQFTFRLWLALCGLLEVKLDFSAYHPQINGQVEHIDQILENYLHHFASSQISKWIGPLQWAKSLLQQIFQRIQWILLIFYCLWATFLSSTSLCISLRSTSCQQHGSGSLPCLARHEIIALQSYLSLIHC